MTKKLIILCLLTCFTGLCLFTIQFCKPKHTVSEVYANNTYVGSEACRNCHAKAYNDWLSSDHFKAMQHASDSSVLGNFNNSSLTADGITSRFFRKEGKFFINTQGDDGGYHDYEVKYTFGFYPLQQYLVAFPGGKMQATRQSWDSKNNKWFHQYAGQRIHYGDWLHWTGNAQNWNTMCADCHSTNLQKNYNVQADTYNTSFDVINVSCESCHGPGKNHIAYIGSADYKAGNKADAAMLQVTAGKEQNQQVNTCAPCHAVQSHIDATNVQSGELLDNYIPVLPGTDRFFADGQIREEDYNYASFLQSKMYARNVKCSNCHNPHSGKLQKPGNLTCLQCHSNNYETAAHTFHTPNTGGSQCKNCHAPGRYYMGNDFRHDHSFRVPRPDLSAQYGTPNACNNCHTNKSAQWAAAAIEKWFGKTRKYHFAEDLIPGSQLNNNSEAHLTKLLTDTAVPIIIKATAVQYLGNINTQSSLALLMNTLSNPHAQMRYEALRSLNSFSGAIANTNSIAALLSDKVKAVRIAAAALINNMGNQQLPEQYRAAYANAAAEREKSLLFQTDFAHGNIALADYYRHNNQLGEAEKFYIRALMKDSLANLARLNLAGTYSAQGKNEAALQTLNQAIHTDPANDQAWYNLGLLHTEMGDSKNAHAAFEKAIALHSENPRLYYNYGLTLYQEKNTGKALKVLQQGLAINASDESLHYAISYVLVSSRQPERAIPYLLTLKKINPSNPDYQQLFAAAGMQ